MTVEESASVSTYLTVQSSHFVVRNSWSRDTQTPTQHMPSWRLQGTSKADWRLNVAQHSVKGVSWRFTCKLSHHHCCAL